MLSFDANEQFPCLANVLEIQCGADHNKHIVATQDIDVGQIVIVEDMYVQSIHSEKESFCKTCLKSAMNFIPCLNCSDVMFCDEKCMAADKIHEMTCNTLRGQKFGFIRIVESVLIAVIAFPNAGTLMDFVERSLASRDLYAPECDTEAQHKYRLFLKLNILADREQEEKDCTLSWAYQLLMEIPEVKQCFQNKRQKRFLMHLILQHQLILVSNGTLFNELDNDTGAKYDNVSCLCIFEALLNFSCTPNASFQRHGNKMFVFVVRPVKKGDELCIADGKKRPGDGHCKCVKCTLRWKKADSERFKSEQDYQDIITLYSLDDFWDPEKRPILKAKLENLMRKYGVLPWTPEFDAFSVLYDQCFRLEYHI